MTRLFRPVVALTARAVGGFALWLGWGSGFYLGYRILMTGPDTPHGQHQWRAYFRSWMPNGWWRPDYDTWAYWIVLFSVPVAIVIGGIIGLRVRNLLVTQPRQRQLAEEQRNHAEQQRHMAERATAAAQARSQVLFACGEIIRCPEHEIVVCGTCGRRYKYGDYVITRHSVETEYWRDTDYVKDRYDNILAYQEVERPHHFTVTDSKTGCPSCQSTLYRFETGVLNQYTSCRQCSNWFLDSRTSGSGSGHPKCPLCHPPNPHQGEVGKRPHSSTIQEVSPCPVPLFSQWLAASVLLLATGMGDGVILGQLPQNNAAHGRLSGILATFSSLYRGLTGEDGRAVSSREWGSYQNPTDGFQIAYPRNWSVVRTRRPSLESRDYRRTVFQPQFGAARMVVDVVFYQKAGEQYELFRQLSRRFERLRRERYQLHSLERDRLGGAPGAKWVFTLADTNGSELKKIDVGTNDHGTIYAVMGEAQPEEFDTMMPVFQHMVESFNRIPRLL
jgi:hypothetical protein